MPVQASLSRTAARGVTRYAIRFENVPTADIAAQVHAICWEGKTPDFAQESLLRGRLGHE